MKHYRTILMMLLSILLWIGGGNNLRTLAAEIPAFKLTSLEIDPLQGRLYHAEIPFVPGFDQGDGEAEYVFKCTNATSDAAMSAYVFNIEDLETGDVVHSIERPNAVNTRIVRVDYASFSATYKLKPGHHYSLNIANQSPENKIVLSFTASRPVGVGPSSETRTHAPYATELSAEVKHHNIDIPAVYTELFANAAENYHTYGWYKYTPVKEGWHTVYANSYDKLVGMMVTEQNGQLKQMDNDAQHEDLGGDKEFYHRFYGVPGKTYYILLSKSDGMPLWNVGLDVVHEQDLPRHLFEIAYPSRKGTIEDHGFKYMNEYPLSGTLIPQDKEIGGLNGSYRGMIWEEFEPLVSGKYGITAISDALSNHDTYAELYELRGNLYDNYYLEEIARCDDGNMNTNPKDFSFGAYLKAGHKYYLAMKDYHENYFKSSNEMDIAVSMGSIENLIVTEYQNKMTSAEVIYEGSCQHYVNLHPFQTQYLTDYTWFKLNPIYTDSYTVTATTPEAGGTMECIILDSELNFLADGTSTTPTMSVTAPLTKEDTYYILLRSRLGTSTGEITADIRVSSTLYEKDMHIAESMATSKALTLGENIVSIAASPISNTDLYAVGTYFKFTAPYTDDYIFRLPNAALYKLKGDVVAPIYEGYYTHFVGSEVAYGVGISNELTVLGSDKQILYNVIFADKEGEELHVALEKGQTAFIVMRLATGAFGDFKMNVISMGAEAAKSAPLLTVGDNTISLQASSGSDTGSLSSFSIYRIQPEFSFTYTFRTSVGNLGVGQGFQGKVIDENFQDVSTFMPLTEKDLDLTAPLQSGKTYYLLVRNHAGTAQSGLTLNVSYDGDESYVRLVSEKVNGAIPFAEQSIDFSYATVDPAYRNSLLGYTWLKFTAGYDSRYNFLFGGDSQQLEGIVLDAGLKQLHSLTDASGEQVQATVLSGGSQYKKGDVFYYLLRRVDGASGSGHVTVTCPEYVKEQEALALQEAQQKATAVREGWNTVSVKAAPEKPATVSPKLHYFTWYKFTPTYDDFYTFRLETDKYLRFYIDGSPVIGTQHEKYCKAGETYLFALCAEDAAALSGINIDITSKLYYTSLLDKKAQAATSTVREGSNSISASSVDATLKHRPLLQYTWRKFVPQFDDVYTYGRATGIELKVIDAEYNEIKTDATLVKGATYYVLYHKADGTSLSTTSLKISSLKYQASLTTTTVKEGSNSISITTVEPLYASQPLLQYTWRKFVPQFDDVYTFGKATGTELKLLNAEFNEVASDATLEKDATYYVLYRKTDGTSGTASLKINSVKHQVSIATTISEGRSSIAIAAVDPLYDSQPLLQWTWRKFVPQFSDKYSTAMGNLCEWKVIDSEFNAVEDMNLTAGETYYVLCRMKDGSQSTNNYYFWVNCPKNLASKATTTLAYSNNSVNIESVVSFYKDSPLLQYTWTKIVAQYSEEHQFYPASGTEYIVLDADMNVMDTYNFTEGKTYYFLYRMADGTAKSTTIKMDSPQAYHAALTTTAAASMTKFKEGSNLLYGNVVSTSYRPLLSYRWNKFVPQFTGTYTLMLSGTNKDNVEYLVLDAEFNEVEDYNLTAGATYYILGKTKTTSSANATLSISCPQYEEATYNTELQKKASDARNLFEGGMSVYLYTHDVNTNYRPLLQYDWFRFTPEYASPYSIEVSAQVEYIIIDSNYQEVTTEDMEVGSTYYVLMRRKDGTYSSANVDVINYGAKLQEKLHSANDLHVGENIILIEQHNPLYYKFPLLQYTWFNLSIPTDEEYIFHLPSDAEYIIVEAPDEADAANPEAYKEAEHLEKGKRYIFMARTDYLHFGYECALIVMPKSALTAQVLHEGENLVDVNDEADTWYRFTPEKTYAYAITSDLKNDLSYSFCSFEYSMAYNPFTILGADTEYFVLLKNAPGIGTKKDLKIELARLQHKHTTPKTMTESELLSLEDLPQELADAISSYKATGQSYEAYAITSAEEMEGFRDLANQKVETNIVGVLMCDIPMNNVQYTGSYGTQPVFDNDGCNAPYLWEPIRRVPGASGKVGDLHLVGQHNYINDLFCDADIAGLCSEIHNLHAYDVFMDRNIISGKEYAATFAGKASNSSFDGCLVQSMSAIYATGMSAGFVADAYNVEFTNCESLCSTSSSIGDYGQRLFTSRYQADASAAGHKLKVHHLYAACDVLYPYSGEVIYPFTAELIGDINDIDYDCNYVDESNFEYIDTHGDLFLLRDETMPADALAWRLQQNQERQYWGVGYATFSDNHPKLGNSPVRMSADGTFYVNSFGDYNGDGVVDAKDITKLQNILLGKSSPRFRDTKIPAYTDDNFMYAPACTLADLVTLIKYINEGEICIYVPRTVSLSPYHLPSYLNIHIISPGSELPDIDITSSDPTSLEVWQSESGNKQWMIQAYSVGHYTLTVTNKKNGRTHTFPVIAAPYWICKDCHYSLAPLPSDPFTMDVCPHCGSVGGPQAYYNK